METDAAHTPTVLAIGGHDPCGGAGIQADIEAIVTQGCNACTLITARTAQNTRRFVRCRPVEPQILLEEAELLLEDVAFAAVKIGLLPTAALAGVVEHILGCLPDVPVVLDPVLGSETGHDFANDDMLTALRALFEHATVLTPNRPELQRLTSDTDPDAGAGALLARGARAVLVTGTHAPGAEVVNTLYERGAGVQSVSWPRLPGVYHGSGCTLAAALAARLAWGEPLTVASRTAQEYTWNTLASARRVGRGQLHPHRLYRGTC